MSGSGSVIVCFFPVTPLEKGSIFAVLKLFFTTLVASKCVEISAEPQQSLPLPFVATRNKSNLAWEFYLYDQQGIENLIYIYEYLH